jgi:D-alanine-D-alanine ligase
MSKLRVGLLFGGRSGEHEVSLRSARSVIEAFDRDRYDVTPIAIDKQGRWLLRDDARLLLSTAPEAAQPALVKPGAADLTPRGESLRGLDVVFPLLHGPLGEDGTVQGLLELAGLPYVGCGVLASSVAMDKAISKMLFAAHGLPQAPYLVLPRRSWETDPDRALDFVESQLAYPVFVKPANMGSSVGVGKARDRAQLAAALGEAARYDRKLLVEAAIDAREIEVSVLGNDEPIASIPGEIVPAGEFYDYAAKYVNPDSKLLIPAPLTARQQAEAQQLAVQAFRIIDSAGLARVDFLLERSSGQLYINEINTMPGFTSISMYPKLWEASGLSFSQLVDRLIELALERHGDRSRSETSYTFGGDST